MRLGTSLRSRVPELTLAAAQTLMPRLGIRRVTDISRLDRLGVPVFASIRPRGRTLRVHAGKGIRPQEARVAALMEAVEFAVAEHASSEALRVQTTIGDLLAQFGGDLKWPDFAPRVGVRADASQSLEAAHCEDVAGGRRFLLPVQLVLLDPPGARPSPYFEWTTNGLASGNTLEEATLHALFEVLERDALAMNKARDESERIDASTLPPPFSEWATRWRHSGIELMVRRVPNEFGLPCFEAVLHERSSPDVNLAAGSGLHAIREMALSRAVCEAAQSRSSFIHGGRDDITDFYARFDRGAGAKAVAAAEARFMATWRAMDGTAPFGASPQPAIPRRDARSMLNDVLRRLAVRGFGMVLRRRFDVDDGLLERHGLFVVRVAVPRCENIAADPRSMGTRLFARVVAHA